MDLQMTLKEFAARVELTVEVVRDLAQKRLLPEAVKVGRRWSFGYDAPSRFLARQQLAAKPLMQAKPPLSERIPFPPEVVAARLHEARSLRALRIFRNPATKAKHKAAVNASWTPERRAAMKARWADPEYRTKQVAAHTGKKRPAPSGAAKKLMLDEWDGWPEIVDLEPEEEPRSHPSDLKKIPYTPRVPLAWTAWHRARLNVLVREIAGRAPGEKVVLPPETISALMAQVRAEADEITAVEQRAAAARTEMEEAAATLAAAENDLAAARLTMQGAKRSQVAATRAAAEKANLPVAQTADQERRRAAWTPARKAAHSAAMKAYWTPERKADRREQRAAAERTGQQAQRINEVERQWY
jgi:hypothetical protein